MERANQGILLLCATVADVCGRMGISGRSSSQQMLKTYIQATPPNLLASVSKMGLRGLLDGIGDDGSSGSASAPGVLLPPGPSTSGGAAGGDPQLLNGGSGRRLIGSDGGGGAPGFSGQASVPGSWAGPSDASATVLPTATADDSGVLWRNASMPLTMSSADAALRSISQLTVGSVPARPQR